MILPNVSHCIEENEVHYTPYIGNIITKFITTTDNEQQQIHHFGDNGQVKKMWVDGVEQQTIPRHYYTFPNSGEHTIEYELTDPTTINDLFRYSEMVGIKIPNGVKRITGWGITETKLTSIYIPASVEEIEGPALEANKFTSIVVDENNKFYDSRNNCNGIIETATNTLVTPSLNMTIPDTVTALGDGCFGRYDFTSFVIPNNITVIAGRAFYMSKLTSITIPNGVESIGYNCFDSCDSLRVITMLPIVPPTIGRGAIPNNVTRINVPAESIEAYKAANGWSSYASKIVAISE